MLAEVSHDPVWEWCLRDNRLTWHGRAPLLRAWGFDEEVGGEPMLSRVHPEDHTVLRKALHDHLAGRSLRYEAEVRLRHARMGWRWVQISGLLGRDESGHPWAMFGAVTDIHDAKVAEARVAWSQRHDPLTGTPNRVALIEAIEQDLHEAKLSGQRGYLLVADLDRFKELNRALGPRVGDTLLVRLAERLAAVGPHTVYRIGADTFALLLSPGSWPYAQVTHLANDLVRAVAVPLRADGHELALAASVGIVPIVGEETSPQDVLRDVDRAVARAKRLGGARWATLDEASESAPLHKVSLESRLRQAVQAGDLSLVYQPIVQLPSREVVAFEALIRWTDPELGPVSPAEFIPLAESTGLILPIGDFVLDEACRTLAGWRTEHGADNVRMNVNLSAVQFTQPDLVQRVRDCLDRYPAVEGHLVLELTETALLERPQDQAQVLHQLRGLGIQIHIDDFGTGYSSLANLVRLPVDALKVDREFVRHAEQDPRARAIVASVARLAQELGLSLTAEGIETEGQAALVNALGRCRGQGYLFARPMPADRALQEIMEPTTVLRRAG
jgi:diguanylate cyclase (GGDEF)-like protein